MIMKRSAKKNIIVKNCFFIASVLFTTVFMQVKTACAQLNPFSSIYYQNQYLVNPAMAGLDKGLNLNLGIRQQWATTPGSPKTQIITGDFNAGNKVGLGLNISNDVAGLIRQTRVVATYAYHLNLNGENRKLNFGLSVGSNSQHINDGQVQGDQGDAQVELYNNQNRTYLDGDFGIAYTSNKLTLQAALPNLNHLLQKNAVMLGVDRSVFMTSVSYKFALDNWLTGAIVEPKLAFRGVYGYRNIFDAGLNVSLKNEILHFYSMYHSSQSESFGFGANINKNVQLMLFYTTETSPLKTYSNGNFEVGLKLHLYKENGQ